MPRLLPSCDSRDTFGKLVDEALPWLPVVAEIARRHGLPTPRVQDHRPAGFVVFVLGPRVLKLTPRWYEAEVTAERICLRAVRGRLPIPTPEVGEEGEIEDWPYLLLTRLPGESPGARFRDVAPPDRARMAGVVGAALRVLHGLPSAEFAGLRVHGGEFEEIRRRLAPDAQRRWGLPPPICGELGALLADLPPLVTGPAVPIHADLHQENLLLVERNGRPEVSALLDFGDAALGPPEFDLAVPALFLARGDGEVLDALFAAYGLPGARADDAFRRRLLAWMFLHPFGNMARFLRRGPDRADRATLAEFQEELLPRP